MIKKFQGLERSQKIFFAIIALTALASGFSGSVFSNYFKEAYNVTPFQRGLIEFPREMPGFLVVFFIASLSRFSDFRISMIAQVLGIIGIGVLSVTTPVYGVMLLFIFIHSCGGHLFMPLSDSIGMSLVKDGKYGERMGQYKGVLTGATMVASAIVLVCFKYNIFSFVTNVKWVFVLAATMLFLVLVLLVALEKEVGKPLKSDKKTKFVFRKKYKYYYMLVVAWGVQKQIMLVYGPWVLIEILGKKVDTIAMLNIIGAFIGIFFIPALGKWVDKFGIKKLLYADALSFIFIYVTYGLLSAGFATSTLATIGFPLIMTYTLFLLDKMSTQMGMIRTLYLKSIAVTPEDITPTLSLGLSLDHIVSISMAILGGIIWGKFGPQYIFFMTAGFSLINLFVATKVDEKELILNK